MLEAMINILEEALLVLCFICIEVSGIYGHVQRFHFLGNTHNHTHRTTRRIVSYVAPLLRAARTFERIWMFDINSAMCCMYLFFVCFVFPLGDGNFFYRRKGTSMADQCCHPGS